MSGPYEYTHDVYVVRNIMRTVKILIRSGTYILDIYLSNILNFWTGYMIIWEVAAFEEDGSIFEIK